MRGNRYKNNRKALVFYPFFAAPRAISPKILYRVILLWPHLPATFRPNPSSFQGDLCRDILQSRYNIGVKHGLLADKRIN